MTFIVGRGRYARQVYPSRRGGGGGAIIQCGYDQVIDDGIFLIPPSSGGFYPRQLTGDPLRVTLPNVVPGNFLEVDFRACMEKSPDYYAEQWEYGSVAVVSFDGNPPEPGNTFAIQDSSTGHTDFADSAPPGSGGDQPIINVTALAGVIIPDGAVAAIVQILFESNAGFFVNGDWEEPTFATLKVCEMAAASIYQPGPGTLIPIEEE
jgi:hypothetical protein